MPRAVVCLPTYNERENVEPMVRALGEVIDAGRDLVLVVDDGSPDGTGEIADRLAAELPWVQVLHRERKEGLGRAYLAAFDVALDLGAELVLEIDCDFSHDPHGRAAADRRLRERRRRGARLPLRRRRRNRQLGARAEARLARRVASTRGSSSASRVRDLTGGFKCFRRGVLEAIDLEAVTANGYAFQIEMTYRALRQGFRVVELPITFVDRVVGWLEDEPGDRARGGVEGAGAAPAGAARPPVAWPR